MREILFRGQDLDGNWYYGSYFFDRAQLIHTIIGVSEWYAVVPNTIGQYTGLKDKNGTKIFEGDIIKACNSKCYDAYFLITYFEDCFTATRNIDEEFWRQISDLMRFYTIEVVGNIYDNPDFFEED